MLHEGIEVMGLLNHYLDTLHSIVSTHIDYHFMLDNSAEE